LHLQADFRLVISNAKTFNPPGTIYHSEAERIDVWASEQIARASAQVIEYETNWNIDVEHDELPAGAGGEDDDDDQTQRDDAGTPARRSPSAAPGGSTGGRRRTKGESTKPGLADSLEPDGHLPGWKDGLSAFPPGSDLAGTMVALKLKGKLSLTICLYHCWLIHAQGNDTRRRKSD
jgi:bromodomain-containing protein 7/9